VLAVAWLAWVYDATSNLAPLRLHQALLNGRGVLRVEQWLHIDPERTLNHWLSAHQTLGMVLSNYYDQAHWIVTMTLFAYLLLRRADIYRPLRNSLVLVNLIGFLVFWRYPVAPPRMLGGFTDVVSSTHALLDAHAGLLASHANELAAMPSLHMAWAAWCALALWRMSRRHWVRGLALAYPCVTALTVLATGNHFVLDLVGGLAALALSLALLSAPRALRALWRRSSADRLRVAERLRRGQGTIERTTVPAYRAGLASGARAGRAIALSVESSKRRATDVAPG
jgi:PAP2 superfamily